MHLSVTRQGASIILALRNERHAVTLTLRDRHAGSLEALLARAGSSEDEKGQPADFEAECELPAELLVMARPVPR